MLLWNMRGLDDFLPPPAQLAEATQPMYTPATYMTTYMTGKALVCRRVCVHTAVVELWLLGQLFLSSSDDLL